LKEKTVHKVKNDQHLCIPYWCMSLYSKAWVMKYLQANMYS
jgi:hypothetical protein